jgi:hypothetical protein
MVNDPLFIIDRFEGNFVVIEHKELTFPLPRNLVPADAKEGDVLLITVVVDSNATGRRRRTIGELEDELFE